MSEEKLTLEEGSYYLIDFEVRIKENNQLIDTNIEDVAKKEKFSKEGLSFTPILLILGSNRFNQNVEEKLLKLGEITSNEVTIELEPEKAFGIKDPTKIKVINVKEMAKEGVIPRPGDIIRVKDKEGTVIGVSGGRAIIDFNHPLAGKSLIYKIIFKRKLLSDEEKLIELIIQRIKTLKKEDVALELKDDSLTVKLKDDILDIPDSQQALRLYLNDIQDLFKKINNVKFEIEWKRPEEVKERILNK
jgi:peptidylprolyl isomerase